MPRYRLTSAGLLPEGKRPPDRRPVAPWRRDPRLRALSKAQVASQPWCSLCGAEENLTADHIIPVSKGGNPHDPANLDTLCRRCNSSKGAW